MTAMREKLIKSLPKSWFPEATGLKPLKRYQSSKDQTQVLVPAEAVATERGCSAVECET